MSSVAANLYVGVRRSPRFRVNFPIKLFAVVRQRKCALQGRSHDISEQGMAIYIPAELEIGQTVQIEFIVPDSHRRLGVSALIRDCNGFRCGVEFQNLTPTEQEALSQCCQKLAGGDADFASS